MEGDAALKHLSSRTGELEGGLDNLLDEGSLGQVDLAVGHTHTVLQEPYDDGVVDEPFDAPSITFPVGNCRAEGSSGSETPRPRPTEEEGNDSLSESGGGVLDETLPTDMTGEVETERQEPESSNSAPPTEAVEAPETVEPAKTADLEEARDLAETPGPVDTLNLSETPVLEEAVAPAQTTAQEWADSAETPQPVVVSPLGTSHPVDDLGAADKLDPSDIASVDQEIARLRALYDEETALCADLREKLEVEDDTWVEERKVQIKAEMEEVQALLDAQHEEEAKLQELEHHIGLVEGEILACDGEILALQQRVQDGMRKLERLAQGGEADTPQEDELRKADQEMTSLQTRADECDKVERALGRDLQTVIEYIMKVNREVGGLNREPTPKDFLPQAVLDHLSLSELGILNIMKVLASKERDMRSEQGSNLPRSQYPEKAGLAKQMAMDALLATKVPPPEDVVGVPVQAQEPEREEKKRASFISSEMPSLSFEQETQLLRDRLHWEMQQVSTTLRITENATVDGQRRQLLRAAAVGDDAALTALLHIPTCTGDEDDDALLGWNEWHVAAAFGSGSGLEILKDMERPGRSFLGQVTHMGLPPLGVACLLGRADSVRTLLLCSAAVDALDARGNTALLWAVASGRGESVVPLLLQAQADPHSTNGSGQCFHQLMPHALPSNEQAEAQVMTGTQHPASVMDTQQLEESVAVAVENLPAQAQTTWLPSTARQYALRALGAQPEQSSGVMSYLRMLKVPVRDSLGFNKNEEANRLARTSAGERDAGFFSDWVTNYTHAGLLRAVEAVQQAQAVDDPAFLPKNRQAVVLTCERLLLFNAATWELAQSMDLSQLVHITVLGCSDTMLLLRLHQLPDIVLDIPSRSRLVEELQALVFKVNAKWGGMDFEAQLEVSTTKDPLMPLLDARLNRAGLLAFSDRNAFLLLPYTPNSVLLTGGATFAFGFMDMHESVQHTGSHGQWQWQPLFFALKAGLGDGRRLSWCVSPTEPEAYGVPIGHIQDVHPLDTPDDKTCLILNVVGATGPRTMTLRAGSCRARDDWMDSIRTMQTGF